MRYDLQSITVFLAGGLVVALGLASCAQSEAVVARVGPEEPFDAAAPIFTPPADASDAAPDVVTNPPLLCIATECPAPYATCSSGSTVAYRCDTNLSNDAFNCGACGNVCPSFVPLAMRGRCVDGACKLECYNAFDNRDSRDCNGVLDDGCEVNVLDDPKNCGACGIVCAAGERCRDGQCGCPFPQVECNGICVDITKDPDNCGACGSICSQRPDACQPETGLTPQNTVYECMAGQCGKLTCAKGSGDCNGDIHIADCTMSDGCESNFNDNANCGACGVACPDGTECRRDASNVYSCLPNCDSAACRCKPGETLCPNGRCVNLLNDALNCGACGSQCARAKQGQVITCEKGGCADSCIEGFADCNGNPGDGCEVDLARNPTNCGACGNRCDTGAGQPCIDGTCLMKECEPGEAK